METMLQKCVDKRNRCPNQIRLLLSFVRQVMPNLAPSTPQNRCGSAGERPLGRWRAHGWRRPSAISSGKWKRSARARNELGLDSIVFVERGSATPVSRITYDIFRTFESSRAHRCRCCTRFTPGLTERANHTASLRQASGTDPILPATYTHSSGAHQKGSGHFKDHSTGGSRGEFRTLSLLLRP